MSKAQVILATLVAYKVALVAFGLWGQRRTRDGEDFFLGGRKLGPLVAAISASASSSSAWTLMGVSGAAYLWGVSAIWIFPACVGGFCLNWFLLAPALRRVSHETGALTMTEVLAGPPGRPLRGAISVVASVIILVSLTCYVATQFQAAGKTFNETFGLSLSTSVLVGSGIVVFYTLLGGFWAVSLTDTLQGLMMAGAAVLLPAVALVEVGGPAGLVRELGHVAVPGYLDPWRHAPLVGGIGFVVGLFGIGLGYPGQPHVVNRFMALRNDATALRTARRIAIGWAVVIYAGMILLGLAGRILFPGLGDREKILVVVAGDLLNPVLAGAVLAAVLSAIMSTADSQLLVAASAVTHDLRLGRESRRTLLAYSRLTVVALSMAAVIAALLVRETIFHWVLFAWSAMGCAFGPLLLVTALRGPVSPGRALAAMLTGFTLSVAAYLGPLVLVDLQTKGGVFDRVLPFLVALAILVVPARRPPPR
jgi:sodium/proline symporter